eukprot:Gregarina_sp_Poly_1__6208@NODE_328_length_9480_cov_62_396048_g50_i1_p1_GENE_NODE_328_length_9480_cov_62_396048_g50_i1NODE_328_length_9480_cov_62_396048_g50_i1_p1_ORF_typecomplete_len389_score52_97Branch/PF02485_21/2e09YqjK/PF13997_6/0_15_NODE_328_length_9480_cov_62_396048_g50_i110922258
MKFQCLFPWFWCRILAQDPTGASKVLFSESVEHPPREFVDLSSKILEDSKMRHATHPSLAKILLGEVRAAAHHAVKAFLEPQLAAPQVPFVSNTWTTLNGTADLVVMFLARGGVQQAEVWDVWASQALKQGVRVDGILLSTQLLERRFVPRFVSRVLQPPETDYLVSELKCRWGRLLSCTVPLLRAAAAIDARWYLLMSAQSVPLKPAHVMTHTLATHPSQTWVDVAENPYWRGCPKHSQWVTLPREHLEFLIDFAQYWANDHWVLSENGTVPRIAAADEILPGCALVRYFGRSALHTGVSSTNDPDISKGWFHQVCWTGCARLGIVESTKRPAAWKVIYRDILEKFIDEPEAFFLRKFNAAAAVLDRVSGYSDSLAWYLSQQFSTEL